MKNTLLILILALASLSFAQDTNTTTTELPVAEVLTNDGHVTIASKGSDVRNVLFDLFTQSKKNFVLEPNLYYVLYLSLAGVEFEEALNIVCKVASLEFEVDNGIYFISKKKVGALPLPKPSATITTYPLTIKRGKLTSTEMERHLTTRFTRANIADVFKAISEQTKIEILIDKNVPAFQLDAYLIDTSLQYALDVICRSTGLTYTLTDDKQVRIIKK